MSSPTIAFIGAGNMSYAIIGGMLQNGFLPANIIASNRNAQKRKKLVDDFAISVTDNNLDALQRADIVVLSVKPQGMAQLLQSIADAQLDLSGKLFISVAAGITVTRLIDMLGQRVPLIRCMPNTPSLVGLGVSGLYNCGANAAQCQLAERIFTSTGKVVWLEQEAQINDIIAVTGSSPAYFFLFMEAIANKAQQLGFSEQQARELVQQTALGAATMAQTQPEVSLSQLRANVTSKGGTTHAAIESLQTHNLEEDVARAMDACIARAATMEQEI